MNDDKQVPSSAQPSPQAAPVPARPNPPRARKLDLGKPCGDGCCGGACARGEKRQSGQAAI